MTLLFAAIVAAFALFSAFSLLKVLLKPSKDWLEAEFLDEDLRTIQTLENQREKLIQQLRDLELDFAMNKVSSQDYKTYKERFEKQAVIISKKIDQVMGGKSWTRRVDDLLAQKTTFGGSEGSSVSRAATDIPNADITAVGAKDNEDAADLPIGSKAGDSETDERGLTCDCGTAFEPNDKFCRECGKPILHQHLNHATETA